MLTHEDNEILTRVGRGPPRRSFAERIRIDVSEGEDWRPLGTSHDPMVREVYGLSAQRAASGADD